MVYNFYCDETCHLEHDKINVMVIGTVWCPQNKLKEINKRIYQIKERNNIPRNRELKWTKVSPAKIDLYKDLINYFFDTDDLHLRALVIPDKSKLNHEKYKQTHDTWYYKMYFDMLRVVFDPKHRHEIYIDIKDTHSAQKAEELKKVCCNSIYDFSQTIIQRLQPIRSEEVQIMQLTDLLIGAIGYVNRKFSENCKKSKAKEEIVDLIKRRSTYSMTKTTLLRENKFNLFIWNAAETL